MNLNDGGGMLEVGIIVVGLFLLLIILAVLFGYAFGAFGMRKRTGVRALSV